MRIFDFRCAECAHAFEAFVRNDGEPLACPQCGSRSVARQPVLQMALRSRGRGRVVDLSSNACPCGSTTHRHAHR